jgi:hypothetical protein
MKKLLFISKFFRDKFCQTERGRLLLQQSCKKINITCQKFEPLRLEKINCTTEWNNT